MTPTSATPGGGLAATKRKLIEVSLPLEVINRESAREKSIRHGHPSTLHLWWARRPLAAARAVLFAQLVDDPSSYEETYAAEARHKGLTDPDETAAYVRQRVTTERANLHDLIRRLVAWENSHDEALLREAHEEILKSTGGKPPPILDPFCGGGTIPLEAQRLGLEAHGSDLNPVAVLITKALIEIPPKFAGRPPVFPGAAESRLGAWPRATGLAEDVRHYGQWMRDRAQERIGHLYPKATLPDGTKATVIAWIWARTITCPNPACRIRMPLVRSWWLGKKRGKEAYVIPTVINDTTAPSGRSITFAIGRDPAHAPTPASDGTVGRTGATCTACGTAVPLAYVRAEGRAKRMGAQLMAVVAEGNRQRVYLEPSPEHIAAADLPRPDNAPEGELPTNPRDFKTPNYGMTRWADLFTNRQLTALITFSDLVTEARDQALIDALATGMPEGDRLETGGTGAAAYADAIATYLGLCASKMAVAHCSLARWRSDADKTAPAFGRQAIAMVWDFAEAQPFAGAGGDWQGVADGASKALERVEPRTTCHASQADAAARDYPAELLLATDPPYYNNIGYSDLSDFSYVWLRRTLREAHPRLLSTILVPKAEELVANHYRHGSQKGAETFFEAGFRSVFARARQNASDRTPISVYYAFKQSETESEGTTSTGWATMLDGMIQGGWAVTATWPMRTESASRLIGRKTNALASSIVLALRPRHVLAEATSRRGFLAALKTELPGALEEMRQGAIAPVDLAQATIGPGMAVFSRYSRVVESDGSSMSVKTALALINQALDEVLAEHDGDVDPDTRFCLRWFTQYGWSEQPFGQADVLARAANTSVEGLSRGGVLSSKAGRVRLFAPRDLPPGYDPLADQRISLWEATMHLARVLDSQGVDACAALMGAVGQRVELDEVQRLSYRLYELTQDKRPADALLFNALGTSWADLSASASKARSATSTSPAGFDFNGLEGS